MEEKKRQGGAAGFLSGLAVLAAALLLAQACRTCRPLDSVFHWQRLAERRSAGIFRADGWTEPGRERCGGICGIVENAE